MKQRKINLNTIISLVLAVLAVVSFLGFTNSYFTASASRNGKMNFGTLNVRFVYYGNIGDGEGDAYHPLDEGKSTIQLFPATVVAIQRNVPFNFSVIKEGSPIDLLAINNMSGSCDAYVRFWIDAYVDGDQTNYGEYFTLNYESDAVVKTNAGTKQLRSVYCIKEAISSTENSYVSIGSQMTLSADAPDTLMGETIKIYISLDAVQVANGAFSSDSGFNDDKGYYSGWRA